MKLSVFIKLSAIASLVILSSCKKNQTDEDVQTTINGFEFVDLGLASGLKWAVHNIGADNPENYGHFYAWGENALKADYTWDNYLYWNGSSITKYSKNDAYRSLLPVDDVAKSTWKSTWRIPSQGECQELLNECTLERTNMNGIDGCKVTGPNGASIFFPVLGYKMDGQIYKHTTFYWSSTAVVDDFADYNAWALEFFDVGQQTNRTVNRCCGCFIRPVSE